MTRKTGLLGFCLLIIMGLMYLYISNNHLKAKRIKAPKIRFDSSLYLYVKQISFERNDLYLNDSLYDSGGISGYSRIHYGNKVLYFRDLKPPFMIKKEPSSDILTITKQDSVFILFVNEEIEFARKN